MAVVARSVTTPYLPFNRPYTTGREFDEHPARDRQRCISPVTASSPVSVRPGSRARVGCTKALLTHSLHRGARDGRAAARLGPGDEVMMPSFTFVSTANAFVLRGARRCSSTSVRTRSTSTRRVLEAAITRATRAIVAVHYAGVGCEMDAILRLAGAHGVTVDRGRRPGPSARLQRPRRSVLSAISAALSFHETKNIIAGEGGALLVNDEQLAERAEIIREKGTNRSRFFRGQVDKYTWVDLGSSFLPSEMTAAFLHAQMEEADEITRRRQEVWRWYHARFAELERRGALRRPVIPEGCEHNAHMFYLLANDAATRSRLLTYLNDNGVNAVFHYVPLHSSLAGRRFGRTVGPMTATNEAAERLVRLPLWIGMTEDDVDRVGDLVERVVASS